MKDYVLFNIILCAGTALIISLYFGIYYGVKKIKNSRFKPARVAAVVLSLALVASSVMNLYYLKRYHDSKYNYMNSFDIIPIETLENDKQKTNEEIVEDIMLPGYRKSLKIHTEKNDEITVTIFRDGRYGGLQSTMTYWGKTIPGFLIVAENNKLGDTKNIEWTDVTVEWYKNGAVNSTSSTLESEYGRRLALIGGYSSNIDMIRVSLTYRNSENNKELKNIIVDFNT